MLAPRARARRRTPVGPSDCDEIVTGGALAGGAGEGGGPGARHHQFSAHTTVVEIETSWLPAEIGTEPPDDLASSRAISGTGTAYPPGVSLTVVTSPRLRPARRAYCSAFAFASA